MEREAIRRRAALAAYVPSLRHYDLVGFPAGEHIGMPSTSVTLVIPVEGPLDLSMPGSGRRRLTLCLSGLHDGPTTIHHDGTQRGLQLALDPLRLRQLLGVPAREVAGTAIELGDVIGHHAADSLLDRLHAENEWAVRHHLVQQALLDHLDRNDGRGGVRPEVERAWSRLTLSGGAARVRDVAAEVGLSPRHLTDEFTKVVGVAPKTVGRIRRFERSASLVAQGHGLGFVAARVGYSDQAHMTREWRRLAGTTPGRWLRDDVLANVQDGDGSASGGSSA
jgi:AraC-like DNA-binding protein